MTHADQLQAKDREIAKLRNRVATLEQLLGEAVRHGYFKEDASHSWLDEVKKAVGE